MELRRRDFLRMVAITGTSAAVAGCSDTTRKLIPYIIPPKDIVPGEATWFASTCRECPAGCGLIAKNRDGRIVKVEGNPKHPISGGALCARGQSSVQRLYNPDRYRQPLVRNAQGGMVATTWDQAEAALVDRLQPLIARGGRIAFVSELITGSLQDLTRHWLSELGQPDGPTLYEPFAYESLRKANAIVFGTDAIPHYRINEADFLLSLGAGFLEAWLSNIDYARQFTAFHEVSHAHKHPFVYVGPRLSMTANNADLWIPVAPGQEYCLGLGVLRAALDLKLFPAAPAEQIQALEAMTSTWPLERVTAATGIQVEQIHRIARMFAAAKHPLVLADGLPFSGPNATAAAVAANLLCALHPGSEGLIDFSQPSAYSQVVRAEEMKALIERMRHGEIDILLLYQANPLFTLPAAWNVEEALRHVPMVVSLSSVHDETSALAHLVLPTDTPLEMWGDYSPRAGVTGILQPVMGRVFPTRSLADILLSTGNRLKGQDRFPVKDGFELLQSSWEALRRENAPDQPFENFWQQCVMHGGLWRETKASALPRQAVSYTFPDVEPAKPFAFTAYPTVQFFDGRTANRPFIQELPDPMTQTTWGGWVEIHPDTAQAQGIGKGEMLRLTSPFGAVDVPAQPMYTVPKGTLAMPIGQGHTAFGQFASGLPANPLQLFAAEIDPESGGLLRPPLTVSIERRSDQFRIANTDGSFFQEGRHIVETIPFTDYQKDVASGSKPTLDIPLPQGYKRPQDIYPPHSHPEYRWAMVVDLDRCIGCSACVVACYAENNVATVGRDQMLKQREMSWIRVQRYFDEQEPMRAQWLVMLCQHCDEAPCESVCPIFAPQHSVDGLNNQVYNRCFGTRFCSQNDPYKVRRFNWYTWTRVSPLEMQLNPDVTVRQKGIMEKCSFCVQRIIHAKTVARRENRKVRDGDFTTACAQTCPTDALIFGNLLDPESRVAKLLENPRAYQVFRQLNTKPAVIYLKRVRADLPAATV